MVSAAAEFDHMGVATAATPPPFDFCVPRLSLFPSFVAPLPRMDAAARAGASVRRHATAPI
ncbi:hypothetical protein CAL12_26470 [Bordetella genomosp. 8]|uniref:Uncharacterized protein n=1 Tax=Bordetella genomosp. 8 TaxID=1416806 RepID=A0A1W6YSD4_9BORD|nr:hypothetical protein [Bordetella genomosp. 8]ARP84010.1 hypothetical protein CAL12_26470 [Bordetella genomosp. 8]